MRGHIFELFVVVVFLAVLLPAVNIAYSDGAERTDIVEDIEITGNETVGVQQDAGAYGANVTITRDGGEELVEGDDYEWRSGVGEVVFGNVEDGDGEIEYQTLETDETTDRVSQLMAWMGPLGWIVMLLTVIGVLGSLLFGRGGWG